MRRNDSEVLASPSVTIVLAAFLIHVPVAAQAPVWAQVASSGPGASTGHAMAYDSQRGRTVLFGVWGNGETWEWDGVSWGLVSSTGPAPGGHEMAYDSQRQRTVLFGGSTTWEWDGSSWALVSSSGPAPRSGHAMAYDSQRGRTVLFGGNAIGGGVLYGDTWEWDGSSWTQVASGGPAARWSHAMAYDSQRGQTVLFGGASTPSGGHQVGDTWEWDGSAWTQVNAAGPQARQSHAMTYDSQRGCTLLFGGVRFCPCSPPVLRFGDTWEWDGSAWALASTTGPAVRSRHGMAYDSQRGVSVVFGGDNDTGPPFYGDTWELGWAGTFVSYGAGCRGSTFAVSQCAQRNPNGGTLTGSTAPLEFGMLVSVPSSVSRVESFDVFTQSVSGTQVVAVRIYPFLGTTPIASTTMTVGPTPGFHTATFAAPVAVPGTFFIAIDVSAQTVVVPNLTNGTSGIVYQRTPPGGGWAFSPLVTRPAYRVTCRDYAVPTLGKVGNPILGSSYDVTLSNALPSTGAVSLTGLSDALFQGLTLPYPLPGAPGCNVLAAPDATLFRFTSPTGTATHSISLPGSPSYIGVELFHQWAVLDMANPLGIVVSNAGRAWVGT